jgi:hypothetical protein
MGIGFDLHRPHKSLARAVTAGRRAGHPVPRALRRRACVVIHSPCQSALHGLI